MSTLPEPKTPASKRCRDHDTDTDSTPRPRQKNRRFFSPWNSPTRNTAPNSPTLLSSGKWQALLRRRSSRGTGYSRVELWIEDALDLALRPPENRDHFYRPASEDFSRVDLVECSLRITERESGVAPPTRYNTDWTEYTIHLDVHVPICCGFQLYFTTSPTVKLATWTGSFFGSPGPMWMDYIDISPLRFWHQRSEVVDFVKELAQSPLNTQASEDIQRWADAVTRGSPDDIRTQYLLNHPNVLAGDL